MSDSHDRKRSDKWDALFGDGKWPAAAPSDGFVDRVLAACDATAPMNGPSPAGVHEPARVVPLLHFPRDGGGLSSARLVREAAPPRSLRGGVLLAAAVAAALLLIPFALRRHDKPQPPVAVAVGTPSYDLGPQRD
jgi:hypothetical protein